MDGQSALTSQRKGATSGLKRCVNEVASVRFSNTRHVRVILYHKRVRRQGCKRHAHLDFALDAT